jgi:hypothetical protein
VAGALVFLSPAGALIGLAIALPLAAALVGGVRRARTRAALGLTPPPGRGAVDMACLAAVPLLLALAAAGPALRSQAGRPLLKSTEAIFVFDVSRSMGAAAGPHSPSRLAQAKAAALELRGSIEEAPVGISSLTTQLLPELFPSVDEQAFARTLDRAIDVLKPPPPAFQNIATTFDPLATLRDQGFFKPATRHRTVVFFTDGESTRFFPDAVGRRLTGRMLPTTFLGRIQRPQAPVKLLVVHVWSPKDHVYLADGTVDAAYRPDLRAPSIVTELAKDAHGRPYRTGQLGAAKSALRKAVAADRTRGRIETTKTMKLAPYAALAALIPLGILMWRRNLAGL